MRTRDAENLISSLQHWSGGAVEFVFGTVRTPRYQRRCAACGRRIRYGQPCLDLSQFWRLAETVLGGCVESRFSKYVCVGCALSVPKTAEQKERFYDLLSRFT